MICIVAGLRQLFTLTVATLQESEAMTSRGIGPYPNIPLRMQSNARVQTERSMHMYMLTGVVPVWAWGYSRSKKSPKLRACSNPRKRSLLVSQSTLPKSQILITIFCCGWRSLQSGSGSRFPWELIHLC